jgi:hypothetical protein
MREPLPVCNPAGLKILGTPSITSRSNRSLRSLGQAKARPLAYR